MEKSRIAVQDFTLMQVRKQVAEFILCNKRGVLVVNVPTGGGKTYGIPWVLKNDVLPVLPQTRMVMLEALRAVTQDVRSHLRDDVLQEPVGMRIGRDEGANYKGERFTIGTTGASFQVVREGRWSVVILDEFDLDQNGDVAVMHNQLYHMLKRAEAREERLVVVLPSATPDLENARKFYQEFTFEVLEVEDRMFDPDILEVDLGSSQASSFKDIVDQYVAVLCKLCMSEGYKGRKIPVGKNVLCTVPSPTYFEDLEQKILKGLLTGASVEVVKVWGRSTPEEKRKLFTGGSKGKTTIFLTTDLIRRGGTPEIYAAFPSGWQVRDYCDPDTGLEGTREERASQADYLQDEGRAARKEKGLVVRSLDAKRPLAGLTFLERKPLEIFLLNLIHHEDVRSFKWWGEVSELKISAALANLERFGAVEKRDGGRYELTSRGRAMRGLAGSLRMRAMAFDADQAGVLPHFVIMTAGMSVQGGVFANAKGRPEIAVAQKPLRCATSDWLSTLRVWGAVTDALAPHLDDALASADRRIERKKQDAREECIVWERNVRGNRHLKDHERTARLAQLREALRERIALIELSRSNEREEALLYVVSRIAGDLAFRCGLYRRGIEEFVKAVVRSASFLNGKTYRVNGSPERTIEINAYELLRMGSHIVAEEEARSGEAVHKVILAGHADEFLYENMPHRGELGYFYRKCGTENEQIGIFPGSSTFDTKKTYLVGIPVGHKGSKYLENIIMIPKTSLEAWLPEVASGLVRREIGLNPTYDSGKDVCVSTARVFFGKKQLGDDLREETPEHPEATKVFAGWLAAQIG